MLNFNTSRFMRGDTMIEVLIAITIFSAVAVASLTLMNEGSQVSQRALEITLVRQEIDAQAEALRFMNASYTAAYQSSTGTLTGPADEWKKIRDTRTITAANLSVFGANAGACPNVLPANKFIVNTQNATLVTTNLVAAQTFSQVRYTASTITAAEGIWIEAVRSLASADANQATAGYIDFHIRACWDSPGKSTPMTLGTIVRLYEPIGNYTSPLAYHPIAPLPPPPTPVVTVVGGASSTWSWPAVVCASGVVADYRYNYTIDSGYASGWTATNNLSFSATTSSEGYRYTLAVQARCFEDATSLWSSSGSAFYIRPVSQPAAITFTIYRDSGDPSRTVWTKASSSCTGGAYLYARADMGVTPRYYWFITGSSGWYGASGAWYYDNFGYWGSSIQTSIAMNVNVPSGKIFYMKAEMKCRNLTTGVESSIVSGTNTSLSTP